MSRATLSGATRQTRKAPGWGRNFYIRQEKCKTTNFHFGVNRKNSLKKTIYVQRKLPHHLKLQVRKMRERSRLTSARRSRSRRHQAGGWLAPGAPVTEALRVLGSFNNQPLIYIRTAGANKKTHGRPQTPFKLWTKHPLNFDGHEELQRVVHSHVQNTYIETEFKVRVDGPSMCKHKENSTNTRRNKD